MHRQYLSDSVSVSELLRYRQMGLRNSEIAKLLDTSPVTVAKYIGPDGRRGRPRKHGNNSIDMASDE